MPLNLKPSDSSRRTLRDLVVTAMLLSVLLAQEYLLMGIPNVQLTVVLLLVYAAVLPWSLLLPLVGAYVFLDNFLMGSLNVIYFVPMLVAWVLLAVIAKWLRSKPLWAQVAWATFFGFLYGWFFAIPQVIVFRVDFWLYLAADLEFEVLMAASNLVSVSLLYLPLSRLLKSLWGSSESPEITL